MKKIILILVLTFFYGGLFAQFAQPTYVKKPKTLQPGSWYMIGKWDSASAAYKDTIGFYLERDSIHLWFNKPVITHSNVSVKGLVNTDSSFYIKGFEILRYYNTCYSVSVGSGSLYKNTTGQYNTAIGDNSLSNNIDAMYNTAVGHSALRDNNKSGGINGWGNTAIGDKALMANTTGGGNIGLGAYAGMNENLSDRLWIGVGDSNAAIIYGYHGQGVKRLRLNADVYLKNKLSFPIFSATINDTLTPTEAELTAAIGLTPAEAGSGGSFIVKSTSGCLYDIISDGTNYYCIKRKKLW